MSKNNTDDPRASLYCSFCGKSQQEVRKLIAGPSVYICDECVELCEDIIREEGKGPLLKGKGEASPSPKEIFDKIGRAHV
mgnify:FL=1